MKSHTHNRHPGRTELRQLFLRLFSELGLAGA